MLRRSLEITTKIGCINNCVYCPQSVLLKAYKGNNLMSIEHFKKILNNTPQDIQIDFTGFCEPFLNPSASAMIRYSIEHGYRTVLITTTTGLTDRDIDILNGLHFADLMIHDYEGKGQIDQSKVDLLMSVVTTDHFEQFKLGSQYRWSRAGNLWHSDIRKGKFECGWTGKEFYRNVVLPNGDVYLCCMDYGLKHRLGNMLTTHYNDLNRQQIIDLTNEENSDVICRRCEICKC